MNEKIIEGTLDEYATEYEIRKLSQDKAFFISLCEFSSKQKRGTWCLLKGKFLSAEFFSHLTKKWIHLK